MLKTTATARVASSAVKTKPATTAAGTHATSTHATDTPLLRLVTLLERIASKDQLHSLQDLVLATGLPKPSLHRMLAQLEAAGLLQREADGRQYGAGARLRRLAEQLLLNSSLHGARHLVLRHLVDELGESCNITTLSAGEVVYLDRVETAAPLRFYLHPGSRVPAHCSASGKLFLSQMTPGQRQRLMLAAPMQAYTTKTTTDPAAVERDMKAIRKNGYAIDDEEFLPGLVCVAVLVPAMAVSTNKTARSTLAIAVQAPSMRLQANKAASVLPALQRAALALAELERHSPASSPAITPPSASAQRKSK